LKIKSRFGRVGTVPRGSKRRYYRINQYIRTPKVRVITREGKQLGVMSVSQALAEAQKAGLDLVEVAPKAEPPVCKILNFRNFLFEKRFKKQKGGRKKREEFKEVRLRPFVSENDLNIRLERIKKFLEEKNKVRISILFRGREIAHKEFGVRLLEKIIDYFGEKINLMSPPKFKGRILTATIGPKK